MEFLIGSLFSLTPVVIVILIVSIRQINEYERGVMFTLGKFTGLKNPGWRLVIPVFQKMIKVDLRVKAVDVPDQDAITKDNISVRINAVIYYKVSDAGKAIIEVEHYNYAVSQLAQTTMRNAVGEVTLDELLKNREEVAKRISGIVDKATDPWGIKVNSVELKDIGKFRYGYTASAKNKDTGIRFLRITDIQEEKVNWFLVPYCKCSQRDLKKYELREEDIVIARIGATTGKSLFIKNPPKSVFASYLIRIRPKKLKFFPEFLSYYLQTNLYWQQINQLKGGRLKTGINLPILQNLLLPLPPLPEQREIAEILKTVDEKIEIEQKKKETYEELFKTLLNKIMSQEIDVEKMQSG